MSRLTKRLSELREKQTAFEWIWLKSLSGKPYYVIESELVRVAEVPSEEDAQLIVETINALPKLLKIIRLQGEALEAYQSKYPCPGFSLGGGNTTGCDGSVDDCPTCKVQREITSFEND